MVEQYLNTENTFTLKMNNDSYQPHFSKGDTVTINKDLKPVNSKYVCAIYVKKDHNGRSIDFCRMIGIYNQLTTTEYEVLPIADGDQKLNSKIDDFEIVGVPTYKARPLN